MKSIRVFLVVVLLATITLTLFLSALHGYRASLAQANELFDMLLSDSAQLLAATTTGSALPEQVIALPDGQFAFQVWVDGRLVRHSANVPDTPVARLESGFQYSNFNNYRWRTYVHRVGTANRWIITAQRLDLRHLLGEEVILKAVLPVVASLPVLGVLVWITVGYGLAPLHRLARRLRDKRADDLGALPVERQPGELIQVITSSNDLLRRLDASFQREKRITSDAAHELRTPISALKVHLHNLESGLPAGQYDLQPLKQAVERMHRLVEQMLLLYRMTPEQHAAGFRPLDLHALVQQQIAGYYGQFEQRRQTVELQGGCAWVSGDGFALGTLVHNLIDNASKYTPEQGQIRLTLNGDGKRVILGVEDSGPGIPATQHNRIFDRFYRLNGDQHDSGIVGCGLGLSIVQTIAGLHGATVSLARSALLGGLYVTVEFAAVPGPAGNLQRTGQQDA